MKLHFENLGLLEQVDLEIADLTLICGENNTGKTYATYAVYGFLRRWRQLLRFLLRDNIELLLSERSEYRFDLQDMFEGEIESHLKAMGNVYIHNLPKVFATDSKFFDSTVCLPVIDAPTDFLSKSYERSIQAGSSGKVLAKIQKSSGSSLLEILISDESILQSPFWGLTDFVIDAIADIVFAQHLPDVHISSAERTGATIFRKELDMARTRMIKALQEMDSKELKRNPFKFIQEAEADYAWPVEDNVEFVRQLEDIDKRTGPLAEANPEIITAFDQIIGGSYKVVKQQLVFQAKGSGRPRFTMNESSSSIRALVDIGFYLRCRARPGDLFIIDEPELNLHPKNQRAFARLVARLVNAGLKVFITTHSDYLVKELNTLIMLNQKTEHTKLVQEQYQYDDAELLDSERIRLYMTGTRKREGGKRGLMRTLNLAKIYPDRGIEVSTFDDTIEIMNTIQSELLYGGDL